MQETISVLTSKLSLPAGPQTIIINNDDANKHQHIDEVQQMAQIVQENSKLVKLVADLKD
jgi:hypothetical protein